MLIVRGILQGMRDPGLFQTVLHIHGFVSFISDLAWEKHGVSSHLWLHSCGVGQVGAGMAGAELIKFQCVVCENRRFHCVVCED